MEFIMKFRSIIFIVFSMAAAPAQGMWNATKNFIQKHPAYTIIGLGLAGASIYYVWKQRNQNDQLIQMIRSLDDFERPNSDFEQRANLTDMFRIMLDVSYGEMERKIKEGNLDKVKEMFDQLFWLKPEHKYKGFNDNEYSMLFIAIENKHLNIIKYFIEDCKVDLKNVFQYKNGASKSALTVANEQNFIDGTIISYLQNVLNYVDNQITVNPWPANYLNIATLHGNIIDMRHFIKSDEYKNYPEKDVKSLVIATERYNKKGVNELIWLLKLPKEQLLELFKEKKKVYEQLFQKCLSNNLNTFSDVSFTYDSEK